MNSFLEYIEIDNFKSYKGKVIIGSLKHFTGTFIQLIIILTFKFLIKLFFFD